MVYILQLTSYVVSSETSDKTYKLCCKTQEIDNVDNSSNSNCVPQAVDNEGDDNILGNWGDEDAGGTNHDDSDDEVVS
jgi:hypothetical protein